MRQYGDLPKACCAWENYLHVERCWKGNPAQMVHIAGFGSDTSTIPQTTWLAKVYRGHFEQRLRRNEAVNVREELPSGKRHHFMTALTIGKKDSRASLAVFLSSPLSDKADSQGAPTGRTRRPFLQCEECSHP